MNSSEKSYYERSLSLLFISFCSGFTAFHYQVVWYQWLMSHPGFDFINIHWTAILFIAGFPLGYWLGSRLFLNLNTHTRITVFILFQLLFVVFALFSKVILYQWLLNRHFVQSTQFFQIVFALFFAMILPPVLMSASIHLLFRTFEKQESVPLFSLYKYYVSGIIISLLVSSILHISLMGVENSIYLGAFLNFWCAVIALIHYSITKAQKPKGRRQFL